MNLRVACVVVGLLSLVVSLAAQTSSSSPAMAQVPSLIQFSNVATDVNGRPLTGVVGITFSLYQEQQGGSPLWLETQNVQPDKAGHYRVVLGSTASQGLPSNLFASGEARWLGVEVQGQEEQPRVMLLAVPYALKAGDAATVGGLPPSAFMLAAPGSSGSGDSPNDGTPIVNKTAVVSGSGTSDFIPLWITSTNLGNSILFQSSGGTASIGINTTTPAATLDVNGSVIARGSLQLPSTGTATAQQGFNSQPMEMTSSVFSSTTGTAVPQNFQWQAEPVNNDQSNASGSLNLLFAQGSNQPSETGLNIASNGKITFVTGQTFPGTGNGTVTSVGSGAGLTGGPITTSGTLSIAPAGVTNAMLANSSLTVTAGTDLTGGGLVTLGGTTTLNLDTTQVPQLNTANTFTGNQAVNGNLSATGVVAGSSFQIGSNLFAFGSIGNGNAFLGFAGNSNSNNTGVSNTAVGGGALILNTTGSSNTASGFEALFLNTTGSDNVAMGAGALSNNSTGAFNTAIGFQTMYDNTVSDGNTAIGYQALFSNGTTGTQNTATGANTLAFNTTGSDNTANGWSALNANTTGGLNTAIGEGALQANTTGSDNVASGASALAANTSGENNVATGVGALSSNTTGVNNVASGIYALLTNNGSDNTGIGTNALRNNTTGTQNTALGTNALESNTTGNDLTCVGYNCTATDPNLHNATAIGAHATVGVSDALVLGGTGAYAVKVGIGTETPSNILTIAQGAGHPLSDGWTTYSSRRWKTNIQTLQGALAKVEQLRGVSYDLKDGGKHEVGVIAEEVGKVVPEVVSYEENGKDARGVDYSRLTALLIEATKEQQRQFRQEQAHLAKALRQIKQQQSLLRAQAAAMQSLKAEVRETRETLRQVKAQMVAAQPTLVAEK
ncbi:MAG: tail fiber domain-containing protein [Terriglobales bacterium]|jgi:trimeric autotransporter adhesin